MQLVMVGATAPSHVFPSLALMRELVARGHRVQYVVGEPLAELVAPTGAEVVAHPSILPTAEAAWPEDIGAAMQLFLDEQIAVLPRIEALDRPVGPCLDVARIEAPERWAAPSDDPRPLVYLAFGTAYTARPEVYRLAVDALADEYRVVIATGKVDPADLEPLPAGVLAAESQPQLDVLHHADVFITHAGMGSAAEGLWFGVPTVAYPQAVDQFGNADRLAAIGSGVRIGDAQLTVDGLRDAVRRALACTSRARELRDEVRRGGGVTGAADAVEAFAALGG